jgi:thiol-disulfide isomerase/thioredoxin
LAHQGKQDEAMKTLDDAMQAGMTSFEQISEDEMFASVRDTEAFQQHVESLEKRALEHEFAETEPFEFDFALQNLANEEVKLSDFAGKFVIVDLWGTWCPPCRAEIPSFVKLQDAYPEDLAIVGITYEQAQGEEAVAQVRTFAEEQGINYSLVMGDEETSQKIPGFGSFPTTLFLDREGKVRLKIVGMHPYEKLESYLKYLMNEGQSEG